MKRLLAFSFLASLVLSASALAQEVTPIKDAATVDAAFESGETPLEARVSRTQKLPELNPSQVTPELYLYMHEQRRHDDPQQAVRRKAEARTAAREARIAAMKWYGMSNSRPQANPLPFMGSYSPAWIGNGHDRYDWYGIGWPMMTLRVEQGDDRR
jgi:hypothetical protein